MVATSEQPAEPPSSLGLNPLIASRRVLLCVGCGGVGKTTTCAALGLGAAMQGKRVLCLTIDPARRLAESLGLERLNTEAQHIEPEVFTAAGLRVPGSLTVMMLDTKTTFDSLVRVLAANEEKRQWILDNVMYQYISTSLAGTQEYMAMEKLYAVKDDPDYDLILLDTPPTSHALDFLDAPDRLVSAIDSPAVRWFLKAFQKTGKLSFNLLTRYAATILRGIGRIIGGGFLEQIALFVTEVNDLFGGWRERADEVASALRGPDVAYVLVTTSEAMCIREVLFFAERLVGQGMRPDAYVVNRVHELAPVDVEAEHVATAAQERGLELAPGTIDRIIQATEQGRRLAQLEKLHRIALEEAFDEAPGATNPMLVHVPELPREVHDVAQPAWVAKVLTPASKRS